MSEVKDRTDWTPQELAAEIASIIRLKDDLWYQGSWFGVPHGGGTVDEIRKALVTQEDTCGTTACVAGWATVLTAPLGTRVYYGGMVLFPDGTNNDDAEELAAEALGIDDDHAGWLFASYRHKREVLAALDAIAEGKDWNPSNLESDDEDDEDTEDED